MVETHGLLGHDSFFSLEKSRRVSNMAVLWGANRLIAHYFEYDPTHLQYPPSNFLTQPTFRYFHHYASTFHRALYLNGQGIPRRPCGHLLPAGERIRQLRGRVPGKPSAPLRRWGNSMDETQEYYSALQLDLARHGWEYHILDSHYLAQAALAGDTLQLSGEQFRALILPPMSHIASASLERIRQFAAAGGLVLALGPQPPEIAGIPQDPPLSHPPSRSNAEARLPHAIPDAGADASGAGSAVRRASRHRRPRGGRCRGFARRTSTSPAAPPETSSGSGPSTTPPPPATSLSAFRVRATTRGGTPNRAAATCSPSSSTVTLHFEPWDAFFVVRNPQTLAGSAAAEP